MEDRFTELTTALQYDSFGEKYLTAFDRMLINKERSALLNNKTYQLPEALERKIESKLNYINKYNWKAPILT